MPSNLIMLQTYSQTISQSCLAVALLNISEIKITKKKEWEVLEAALKYSKDDFAVGHIEYLVKKYNKKFDYYLDNKEYGKYVNKKHLSKNVKIFQEKITLNLINKLIKNAPIILQIDSYAFWRITHVSHFVIITEKTKTGYKVYDPWFGKFFNKTSKEVSTGIRSLRNLLKFWPQIIQSSQMK